MDMTEQFFTITSGVIVGSILLRCFIKKCKRDYYDVHKRTPANTPEPPRQPEEQKQQYPQPTAPPSYVIPPYYTQQHNPYNSYSSYPQDQRYVVYIPPVTPTARHI